MYLLILVSSRQAVPYALGGMCFALWCPAYRGAVYGGAALWRYCLWRHCAMAALRYGGTACDGAAL
jgi:hypothetical protein